ncbi:hypothetical protein GCM10010112_66050 [Actinoplanes lobatus]|uniref:ABC transporter n=1 Tax=Actinoplanes lobatus TaxID=113568 RepID=A0A7W7MJC6_9ACTN|nr:hypothetical protein [Actinoplanes lobatus]GGN85535.1 hypothetical protein GCM10010112_66050 [Actinoplanes lobatus]GIE44354.1 hypothetical protein Alo02nite_72520 [Actinoplanes lobatus]
MVRSPAHIVGSGVDLPRSHLWITYVLSGHDQLRRSGLPGLAGCTGLVIAHRLTQAAACDRIVVMEHGRITENGTHSDLIAAGGVYARLWSAWEAGQGAAVRTLPVERAACGGGSLHMIDPR